MSLASPPVAPSGSVHARIVTLNVRYATKSPVPGEEPWSVRAPKLCAQFAFIASGHTSVFLCLQEVLYSQLIDIQSYLGPSWSHIGQGRDDGRLAGEFSPIFFRADTWDCVRNQTFWLSPTTDVPSRGWDAALNRIVTTGSFRNKETGTAVAIMSTHLDHQGQIAREESARLLLTLARDWTDNRGDGRSRAPLFLGGDFNSTPSGKAYTALTLPGSGMSDISELVPQSLKYGNPDITYTSFGESWERPRKIDFLFVQERLNLKFVAFGILSNKFDDGVYLSDHRPVVADLEIPIKDDDTLH
ncbi:Endonuclease/exonuclease/phosphatase [Lasiosphaeria miniovina]|uniref:Endonuclease/exonuclease/phosphatase n=1 Tax=Lasiosphaeria miniovina TaxID=1954250 RepID=A0AA40B4B4_9PEZI|nr:Endonuclease/exonuclease/phosphatase [Lasiosphaeria miniovina]KAK0727411.1 Endonuclease/exonuclease/phosphatase [Lasiosphaeria miniovina]